MIAALDAADAALVGATPLFGDLAGDAVAALLTEAFVVRHDGGLLFAQGDPADRFFVVLAGMVTLFALTETGDQSIVEVVEPGQSFAEGAIFASRDFPLHAECAAGTRLLHIPARPFLARLERQPGLAAAMLAALVRWQRRMGTEIAELKGLSPVQRLGLALLGRIAPDCGGPVDIRLPFTKAQLASRIGITPESLSRALARLRPLGVDAAPGGVFVIADPAALRRLCGDP